MRGKILIVDDEAGPRESLRMILKQYHDVRTASNGQEALEGIGREKPDLVFLDLRMPGMSGTEVLKRIKSEWPDVEVAIITAYAAVESARVAVQCGAIDYLTKPYSVADVERIVDKALRSRRRQHEAEMLSGQLAKLTEALARRASSMDSDDGAGVGAALDRLRRFQSSLDEDMASLRELSELGEVAAEVTHDINNLLTIILTSAQFLIRQIDSERETDLSSIASRLSGIVQAAEDCSMMVRRVRDFTRTKAEPAVGPVNINDVVSAAADLEREEVAAKGRAVEFRVHLEPVPIIEGDEVALRNIIVNLIENSLDALKEEGGWIELRTSAGEGKVVIQVRDNGQGMPPEVAAKATRAFFSTKASRGTGLGLSIAEKTVKQHHGQLRVDSEVGVGTTVTIELPVHAPLTAAPAGAQGDGQAGTVLLIEDEKTMRELMAAILEAEGYRVHLAEDGLAGMARFQELSSNAHGPLVVVTDHEMPGMTGRELAGQIKQISPKTPVLIVSGYISSGGGPEDELISKPFDIDEFTGCVQRLMKEARASRSAV
ncbi:MAG: response regulator [Armatimonadetes bacterium]|nr:response regulator [Armatimonadota bacterium]